ncbi:MAG: sugar ABC transporter substrate-binding protein [Methylobacteriaceae bacterium]|nr:sugar ABC transporter substrate-binding protein [Methylobacteriaceae bacterium]MBV9634010.1 sugar ABC transporter substrate-binding protein [Methylobacteriaceae bacterium]MBV9702779.1 sugar ABC transporter substrate-binding protein [Methylobacteriaceae bacterium]
MTHRSHGPNHAVLKGGLAALAVAAAFAVAPGAQEARADGNGLIVVFMPPGTDNYLAQWQVGARDKAKALGYDIKIVENSRDQAEEDSQVQQEIASGEKVAGYIWWPFVNAAGVGSLRALSQTGVPVIATNQFPVKGAEKYWLAYAGVNDFFNAQVAAKMLLKACKESKTVKCDKGLIFTFPAGYSAGSDRRKGFIEAAPELKVIDTVDTGGFMQQEGYKVASQVIPAHKKDLSWVYTENDSLATGVIQALKENGLQPGKDVLVVGGTCHGDTTNLLAGEMVGTGIQAAYLEGAQSVQTIYKYLATKKVEDGEVYLPADPDKPPPDEGAPHKYNFIPNPSVGNTKEDLDKFRLWGMTFAQLCNY